MCEPVHSIIQWPPDDPDSGEPLGTKVQQIAGKAGEWLKQIRGWFHLSAMGNGHSEATGQLANAGRLARWNIPSGTKWEADWCLRKVMLDEDAFFGQSYDKGLAEELATQYANRVSIGDLTQLRRFIEVSMQKTGTPYLYVNKIMAKYEGLFSRQGRDLANAKMRMIVPSYGFMHNNYSELQLKSVVSALLGLTRKRHLMNDYWADDGKLWVPTQPKLVTP